MGLLPAVFIKDSANEAPHLFDTYTAAATHQTQARAKCNTERLSCNLMSTDHLSVCGVQADRCLVLSRTAA